MCPSDTATGNRSVTRLLISRLLVSQGQQQSQLNIPFIKGTTTRRIHDLNLNMPLTGINNQSICMMTRSFDVFFDPRLNKRLSKQWWGWWFETLSRSLWCHRNVDHLYYQYMIYIDGPAIVIAQFEPLQFQSLQFPLEFGTYIIRANIPFAKTKMPSIQIWNPFMVH